jgi:protein-S-isoprenylcysteine O-methyltransferase Ste14
MALPNRHGAPVDPVPFVVVSGLAFMLSFSFGPLYGLAFGLSLPTALAVSGMAFLVVAALAFYRQVWNARPTGETSVAMRAEQLLYGALAFAVVVAGATLPLVL